MWWLKNIWDAIKPDPYLYIAWLMQMEGYSDREIDEEIYRLKELNNDL